MLHTTKRRVTINLETINNQSWQKIKLHGTQTTKELKKHSSKPVGGAEMGSWAERICGKAADYEGQAGLATRTLKTQKLWL